MIRAATATGLETACAAAPSSVVMCSVRLCRWGERLGVDAWLVAVVQHVASCDARDAGRLWPLAPRYCLSTSMSPCIYLAYLLIGPAPNLQSDRCEAARIHPGSPHTYIVHTKMVRMALRRAYGPYVGSSDPTQGVRPSRTYGRTVRRALRPYAKIRVNKAQRQRRDRPEGV
eukprot:scaffold18299_cov117-Isochrysis_galbana.AAC.3